MLDSGLPDKCEDDMELPKKEKSIADGSLSEDIVALIDDGKTYFEAEIAFQKTRLAFTADRGKSGILFGIFALAVLHLALVALVVGAIFALTPLLSALGATALVAGMLLVAGAVLAGKAKNRFTQLIEAYDKAKK